MISVDIIPYLRELDRSESSLIAALQKTQKVFGYLPEDALEEIAGYLNVPLSRIYGIVTFYSFFNLNPPGKHTISVCLGTSCHVKGGDEILEELRDVLGVDVGGTTEDRLFSLKTVRCLGCCGISPVIDIDGKTFARAKKSRVKNILEAYREGKE